MGTLLSLCQDALEGVDGFDIPTTIIGNNDPTAVLLKSAARQVGRELVRDYKWQNLKSATSFTTSDTVIGYSVPTDFQRFANLTFWNTDEQQPLIGPLNSIGWASLTRGIYVLGIRFAFHMSGGFINLTPTPTSAVTIGYDYYSKNFCTSSGGTPQSDWLADGDLWRLDDDIAVLGIRSKFKARKGLPFAEEKADYMTAVASMQFDDTPKPLVDLSGVPRGRYDGIPEGNFG